MLKSIEIPDEDVAAMKKEAIEYDMPFKKYIEQCVSIGRSHLQMKLSEKKKKKK